MVGQEKRRDVPETISDEQMASLRARAREANRRHPFDPVSIRRRFAEELQRARAELS